MVVQLHGQEQKKREVCVCVGGGGKRQRKTERGTRTYRHETDRQQTDGLIDRDTQGQRQWEGGWKDKQADRTTGCQESEIQRAGLTDIKRCRQLNNRQTDRQNQKKDRPTGK